MKKLISIFLVLPFVKTQELEDLSTLKQVHVVRTQELEDLSTLKQVHVIFRHGDRTPDLYGYPNDPYLNLTYYPTGRGQLTLLGKKQEYTIGINLRERYNKFLGNVYLPEILEARSTDMTRTKMSLQLVLAGLWPPSANQNWNDKLPWQPIPYLYNSLLTDKIMRFPFYCNALIKAYKDALQLPEVKLLLEPYQWVYDYVNEYSGINATMPIEVASLYHTLFAQEQMGLALPDWTNIVYPDALKEVAVLEYIMRTYTDDLKRETTGGLITKIRDDAVAKIMKKNSKKMYLYSGHEITVAYTLIALDIFKAYPHVPPYGSYILLELHEKNREYGFQIYYTDYTQAMPTPVVIPGCDFFCPIQEFLALTETVVTTNYVC